MNVYERVILQVLQNAQRHLSTAEVAKYAEVSWVTANKYLEKMYAERQDITMEEGSRKKAWNYRKQEENE